MSRSDAPNCSTPGWLHGRPAFVPTRPDAVVLDDSAWRARLDPTAYVVLREGGTERAFTGAYHDHHAEGGYACAGCALPLFDGRDKFDSGTGWPSYVRPVSPDAVAERADDSHGMRRVEVLCARCGGHLGHVFPDGPRPTGLRYCINSAALRFVARPQ